MNITLDPKDVKIKLGKHLWDSHVFVCGKELPCTKVVITLDAASEKQYVKVELTTNTMLVDVDEIVPEEVVLNVEEIDEAK